MKILARDVKRGMVVGLPKNDYRVTQDALVTRGGVTFFGRRASDPKAQTVAFRFGPTDTVNRIDRVPDTWRKYVASDSGRRLVKCHRLAVFADKGDNVVAFKWWSRARKRWVYCIELESCLMLDGLYREACG